jgi:hypothetical protein
MFWLITLVVVAAFVAAIGWLGRAGGSAKGGRTSDLDGNIRRTRGRAEGATGNYENR